MYTRAEGHFHQKLQIEDCKLCTKCTDTRGVSSAHCSGLPYLLYLFIYMYIYLKQRSELTFQ